MTGFLGRVILNDQIVFVFNLFYARVLHSIHGYMRFLLQTRAVMSGIRINFGFNMTLSFEEEFVITFLIFSDRNSFEL